MDWQSNTTHGRARKAIALGLSALLAVGPAITRPPAALADEPLEQEQTPAEQAPQEKELGTEGDLGNATTPAPPTAAPPTAAPPTAAPPTEQLSLGTQGDPDATTVTTWQGLKSALAADGNVKLGENITWSGETFDAETEQLLVPQGKTVTLDLNGHTIDRGLGAESSSSQSNGLVIRVEGNLTIEDNSTEGTGAITGGNNSGSGGGLYVESGGSLNVHGGTISGNHANGKGGGVYVGDGGTLRMDGGTIGKNSSSGNGGGVYVSGSETPHEISMDAVIQDNHATGSGGGVYVGDGGTLRMNGGTISGNKADGNGGGVYAKSGGTLQVNSGTISGNGARGNGGGLCVGNSETPHEIGGDDKIGGDIVIEGNNAGNGGGAYVENGGTLLMHSGTIRNNTTSSNGAGVYVNGDGTTFEMDGTAVIEGNQAYGGSYGGNGGGVRVSGINSPAVFTMSGSAKVQKNITHKGAGIDGYLAKITLKGDALVTQNKVAYEGGGIHASDSEVLMQDNATVSDNGPRSEGESINGAGIYVYYRSSFTMEGGRITGNSCGPFTSPRGGGLYYGGGGGRQFGCKLLGGTISNNSAGTGGGVYLTNLNDDRDLAIGNVTITENTASKEAGGLYVPDEGASVLKFSGAPVISRNFAGESRIASNLFLPGSRTIAIDGELEDSARIGVTAVGSPRTFTTGFATNMPDKDPWSYFFSDVQNQDGTYVVDRDANGEAQLVKGWTITYDPNGGEGEMAPARVRPGVEYTLDKSGFTQFGGRLSVKSWNTEANGSGTSYALEGKISSQESVTLYAQWDTSEHTVEFDSRGGTAVQTQTVYYDETATEPESPTRAECRFDCWCSDEACTQPFDFATPIRTDITLYARWIGEPLLVTFWTDGGTTVESQTLIYGDKVTKPSDPTRDGYTFKGWFADEPRTKEFDFSTPVTDDITIYAKWEWNSTLQPGPTPAPIPYKPHPDVPANSWYASVVFRSEALGLVGGYDNGNFGPNDPLTRGQAAVILWHMAGEPAKPNTGNKFPDVMSKAYYANAVLWASSVGVANGYADGRFGPNDYVTREQLATMIANYARTIAHMSIVGSAANYAGMKDSKDVSAWARTSMGWCFNKKILGGTADGRINPRSIATRAEATKMMLGLYDLIY